MMPVVRKGVVSDEIRPTLLPGLTIPLSKLWLQ